MKACLFFFFTVLSFEQTFSQSSCREKVIYQTSSVGNGQQSMPLPMMFVISNDTLRIGFNSADVMSNQNVPFLIKERNCVWNSDFSEGNSKYKLEVQRDAGVAYPTCTITIKDKKGQIVLQYDNSEPRVFELILSK